MAKLFTIGFTKKTAEEFFSRLKQAKVRHVIDVRLNNSSQLAGFAKQQDLEYFLKEIGGIPLCVSTIIKTIKESQRRSQLVV
jgi:uncharacterized protein (DUF488 family)